MIVMDRRALQPTRAGLILVTIAGLVIDAVVHLDKASVYDGNATSVVSQGDLFRAEAAIALLVAVLVIVRLRRYTAALAFLVGAGGAALVTLYRYVNVGQIGPIPQMYENTWTPPYANPWKLLSLWAEVAAAMAALGLVFLLRPRPGSSRTTSGAGTLTSGDRQATEFPP